MSADDPVTGQAFQTAYVDGRQLKRSDGAAAAQRWWATRWAAIGAWALAGWPVWRWFAARLDDGSDEPWGLAALVAALAFLPWRQLREPLSLGAAALAATAVLTELIGYAVLPAIVRGGLWMLGLMALLGGSGPTVARAGMLLLSLPVVATAQFYLGYPLRALTAACSVPLLHGLGYAVARQGTALRWAGETVLVDAPCSGIQMLWTGLLAACAMAATRGLGGAATLRLLRHAGMVVAAANVLRCVVLFLLEVRGAPPAHWLHEAIGLALFGGALGVVAWLARRKTSNNSAHGGEPFRPSKAEAVCREKATHERPREAASWPGSARHRIRYLCHCWSQACLRRLRVSDGTATSTQADWASRRRRRNKGLGEMAGGEGSFRRYWRDRFRVPAALGLIALLGGLLGGAALRPFWTADRPGVETGSAFPGWPEAYEGRALVPLIASEREARFAGGFPGRVAAFSDGERTVVLRWVPRETRKLHPALHCLRGLGYAVQPGPVWRDEGGRCWGTIVAQRAGRRLRVRERIADAAGAEWTDVSAWWWDAWRGRSVGPWWAVTVLEG